MSLSKEEYDKSSFFYEEIMNSFKMDFSLYEDLVQILNPKSILELGCGMGRLFPIFMKEAELVTGVDLSEEMLSKAKSYYKTHNDQNTTIELINDDICSFKLNKKYDLIVIALSLLKHLKTEGERLNVLNNAKNHLNKNGFIIIDHTPFLYSSTSTDWINSENSLVSSWVPEKSVLKGYQWKKTVNNDIDILQWRFNDSEQIKFEVQFTTYQYDVDELIKHINKINMKHDHILSEWGVNGLGERGNRFIALISFSKNKINPKKSFIKKILERNEILCSDHNIYIENKIKNKTKRCHSCLMPLSIFETHGEKCEYCIKIPKEKENAIYNEDKVISIARKSNEKYNCLVPISGGRDSAFVLYYAKKILNLKPLAVHFNNGFITKEALSNLNNMTVNVGVDFISHSINSDFIRKLMKLFFKRNGEFCTPCNRGKKYVAQKFAVENDINLVLLGFSYAMDKNHVTDDFNDNFDRGENIFNEVIKGKLTDSELHHYKEYLNLENIAKSDVHMVHLPDMIDFDYKEINNVLVNELGWSHPDGQFFHGDCYLNPFVDHLIHNRFGYSEKQVFISNLIKYKYIDKNKGIDLINSERITQSPERAIGYIKQAFNMDRNEIDNIINTQWKKKA